MLSNLSTDVPYEEWWCLVIWAAWSPRFLWPCVYLKIFHGHSTSRTYMTLSNLFILSEPQFSWTNSLTITRKFGDNFLKNIFESIREITMQWDCQTKIWEIKEGEKPECGFWYPNPLKAIENSESSSLQAEQSFHASHKDGRTKVEFSFLREEGLLRPIVRSW